MDQKHQALVAMSGGVDSSVAAFLVMEQGFHCTGGTMLLHSRDTSGVQDARAVCRQLGIDFHSFDAFEEFHQRVVDPFIQSYELGDTPNPCIQCNRHMKFGYFLRRALELGCGYIATGHYARIQKNEKTGRYSLQKALNTPKDQSYFLYSLTQHQLAHTLFPLGSLSKEQVRAIAQAQGFLNAKKHDSQDICFIPDGDHRAFMQRYTGKSYPAGDFLDLNGQTVGRHSGAVGYTLGQRKGLGLAMGEPVYVCGKDMEKNTVTVGPNEALFRRTLLAMDWNWISIPDLNEPLRVWAKARSRMAEQPAIVFPEGSGICRVEFDQPQRAITPGQAVVLYDGDNVVGGGTITQVL